ncbi:uncharacterized protein [Macrobrachium rosenbergii]|uniref:uncharacterized protein n=1 Tax=Macrobrachium rosenbergii TaxID=79674 RepID=UPI0034D4FE45
MAAASKTPRNPAPVGSYVLGTISGRMMLIDTGAMRSVFPPSREDRRRPPDLAASLTAANGSPILSYGTRLLSVSILGQRYKWNFIVADVRTPLLGADLLAHFGLVIDIGRRRLLDTESCRSLPLSPGPRVPIVCSVAPHQCASLLKEFRRYSNPSFVRCPGPPPNTGYIITSRQGPPRRMQSSGGFPHSAFRRPRRPLPRWSERLRHIQRVLQCLQESGLVIRFDKCTFGVDRVEFLSHKISPGGVHPVASKVEAVVRFPTPTSVKAVQEFLGMVNYYRRFIPVVAHTMAPLTEILKGLPKITVWGPSNEPSP